MLFRLDFVIWMLWFGCWECLGIGVVLGFRVFRGIRVSFFIVRILVRYIYIDFINFVVFNWGFGKGMSKL